MRSLRVLTQNLYIGADAAPLVLAADREAYARAARKTLDEVQAADPACRMAALAATIARADPHLVALQEVANWDFGDTACDFLEPLLEGLPGYRAVAVEHSMGFRAPEWSQIQAGLEIRNAILARDGLEVADARGGPLAAAHAIPSPALGEVRIARSWCAVQAGGTWFVNAHLDDLSPDVQLAQARELLEIVDGLDGPLALAGDFNSDADGGPAATATYGFLLAAGLTDAWAAVHPGRAGPTWEGARLDLVLTRDAAARSVEVLDSTGASDHSAVLATLAF